MQLVICLGEDTDKYGNTIKNRLVPYSFRVENIQSKCSVCRDILWIFSKNTNELKYDTLTFGNANKLEDLPQSIKEKIDVKRED